MSLSALVAIVTTFFSGIQQNNIRWHAMSTHREEFDEAQQSGLRYWRSYASASAASSTGNEVGLLQ